MELTSELTVQLVGCDASDDSIIDTSYEHNYFRFYIIAPIFVIKDFHRYHVGWVYNEDVKDVLRQDFYVPSDIVQKADVFIHLRNAYHESYKEYEMMLEKGINKEVASVCLPLGTYSSMYITCNARSLMEFLSLDKAIPEVERIARQMEEFFKWAMPLTHNAFVENGYVAP